MGRVVAGSSRALAERGHQIHVAGPAPDGSPAPIAGVRLHPWPKRAKIARIGPLLALQRSVRAQVVHFHSALPHGELIACLRLARFALGSPRIFVTPHTAARSHYPKRRARLGLRAADGVITPSAWAAEHALRAGAPPAATHVVHAGIELPPPVAQERREPIVLALGRLVESKGMDVLIEAFDRAAVERPDWRLWIGGSGHQETALRALAKSTRCADRIEFLGHVSGEAKREALERASIGVVPSRRESFGGALLEFEAQGLACVATRVGGMVEIVDRGEAARTVPPDDPAALARMLAELMDDPDRRRSLGAAARRFASALSWEACAERIERIYRGETL